MANSYSDVTEGISQDGLTLLSYNQILEEVQDDITAIYAKDGEPINYGSETQDGQFTNILAQLFSDNRELIRDVYNSFNPDNCSGSVQDSRYALNYIERKQGTFTIQNIDIVVNQTVTLRGLDANYNNPNATAYAISDNAGQLWFLIDTVTLTAGTYLGENSLAFRSQNYGAYVPTINSITNQVEIVIGVESVTNSVAPTTLGENQETDSEFKIRRTRSTTSHGQNNLDALLSQLLNLSGVTDAYVHNNASNSTDATGTAANTVWVIVEGGANADIGALIYQYSCGKPTRGSITVNMLSLGGETFPTSFDRAVPVPLYIKFDYASIDAVGDDFLDGLKTYIVENLSFKLNQTAETSLITEIARLAIASNGGDGFPLNVELSTGGVASASKGSSTGITSASVDSTKFQAKNGDTAGTYTFSFDGTDWKLSSDTVTLADYGISYEGTPVSGDEIIITYTASVWTDLIESASLKDKFVVDATRIEITNTLIS